MPRAAAFFDLDKTLMAGSSGMPFARVAMRHGIVSRRQLASWGVEHLRYRLRGTTDERTTEVLQVARELITGRAARGRRADEPRGDGGDPAAGLPADAGGGPRPPGRRPRDLHRQRRRQRRRRTAGPRARHGRRHRHPYEVDAEGAFTGRFDGPFVYGPGKVEAMEAFAAEHGIDLAESYAYSDSLSDLPMLEAVGHPVVVNPDPALAAIAKREGWQTMRFERLGRRLAIARHRAARRRRRLGRLPLRRPALRLDFPHGGGPASSGRSIDGARGRVLDDVGPPDRAALRPESDLSGGPRGEDRRARRVPLHPRALPLDVPGQALDDAPVRRLRHGRGDQRALPLPARPRPDRALDRLRHADPDGLRLRPRPQPRRGRPRGRRRRQPRRHGAALRGHPARRRHAPR